MHTRHMLCIHQRVTDKAGDAGQGSRGIQRTFLMRPPHDNTCCLDCSMQVIATAGFGQTLRKVSTKCLMDLRPCAEGTVARQATGLNGTRENMRART